MGGDRSIEEAGILDNFTNALARDGRSFFEQARHRGPNNDPPDCEAINSSGARIGIEITELVDGTSIEKARRCQSYNWKDWREDFVPSLGRLLHRKDAPAKLKGGPYSEYVLLIHTDEPWLDFDQARRAVSCHEFPATSLITSAYFMLSYCPRGSEYPCISLRIASNSRSRAD